MRLRTLLLLLQFFLSLQQWRWVCSATATNITFTTTVITDIEYSPHSRKLIDSMTDCLSVEMVGRMGNLMFQYAGLVGLCKARGQSYLHCARIPTWQLRWSDAEFPLSEFVHAFNLRTDSPSRCVIHPNVKLIENGDDSSIKYDESLLHAEAGSLIKGYMQSWRYFHPHAKEEIYSIFHDLPASSAQLGSDFISKIRQGIPPGFTIVGVHLRLGDKLNNSFYNQWALSPAYYNKAIDLMAARHSDVAFVYFTGGSVLSSPDQRHGYVQWTREHVNTNFTYKFFERSGNHFIAMHALMRCDAVIAAHSSFSWWAAYLSGSREVVAPRSLFPKGAGGPEYVVDDYYLPWWSLLDEDARFDRIVAEAAA